MSADFSKNRKRAISVGESVFVLSRKMVQLVNGDRQILVSRVLTCRTLVFDQPRQSTPKAATTKNNMTKNDLVFANHRLNVCDITGAEGISNNGMDHILHEILSMIKLSALCRP